jgi:hypothetical protein
MQLKGEGLSESKIIDILKQEGTSPKEINDALNPQNYLGSAEKTVERHPRQGFLPVRACCDGSGYREDAREPWRF